MSVGKENGRSPWIRVNNGKYSGVVMGGTLHYHSPEVSFVTLETWPNYIWSFLCITVRRMMLLHACRHNSLSKKGAQKYAHDVACLLSNTCINTHNLSFSGSCILDLTFRCSVQCVPTLKATGILNLDLL